MINAYTKRWNTLANCITSEVSISPAESDPIAYQNIKWLAVWDTGTTNTCISPKVVERLKMRPSGREGKVTANGIIRTPMYYATIQLPNNVIIGGIPVSCADLGDYCDVLIGMDVITQGDFSITNVDNKTIFSFRMPSLQEVDYTDI